MTTTAPPASPRSQFLTPARFEEIRSLVARRRADPDAAAPLFASPDVQDAWTNWRGGLQCTWRYMVLKLQEAQDTAHALQTHTFGRSLRKEHGSTVVAPRTIALYTAELAIALGELERLSRLTPAQLADERAVDESLDAHVGRVLGDERWAAESLYPFLSNLTDVLYRLPRPTLTEGQSGLPLPRVLTTVEQLQTLQEKLFLGEADGRHPILKVNIGTGLIPALAKRLADHRLLALDDIPAAFDAAYERRWHTKPTTKSAFGGFVDGCRDRTRRYGSPALLIVCAASSDGEQRGVAARSERTPEDVYDRLLYDNSRHVLREAVQSTHFSNYKAQRFVDANLPLQLEAIMLWATDTSMAIRVAAAEKAIHHLGVSVKKVFDFLNAHVLDPHVPHGLWLELAQEMTRRLRAAEVQAKPDVIAAYRDMLRRFALEFICDLLEPYRTAAKAAAEIEHSAETAHRSLRVDESRQLLKHRRFMEAREFLAHTELMEIVVEGVEQAPDFLRLLEICLDAKLPITKPLLLKVMKHPDPAIKTKAMKLAPHLFKDLDPAVLNAEIEGQIAADVAALADWVKTHVIPNYTELDSEPRRLSRMHHYFQAATVVPYEKLNTTFHRCHETDPVSTPEAFRTLALLEAATHQDAREPAAFDVPPIPKGVQADLFTPARSDPLRRSSRVAKPAGGR